MVAGCGLWCGLFVDGCWLLVAVAVVVAVAAAAAVVVVVVVATILIMIIINIALTTSVNMFAILFLFLLFCQYKCDHWYFRYYSPNSIIITSKYDGNAETSSFPYSCYYLQVAFGMVTNRSLRQLFSLVEPGRAYHVV